MPGRFTLGKTERLKSRKRIGLLFSDGRTLAEGPLKLFYRFTPAGLQFGAGASVKNFRKAVERNRVKRLLRESWRLQKNSLSEILKEKGKGLDVFVIYSGKELPHHKEVFDHMAGLLRRLEKII